MQLSLQIGWESVQLSPEVLDAFLRAINQWIDTGDILADGVDPDVLADAKAVSGDIRLLLIRALAAEKKR